MIISDSSVLWELAGGLQLFVNEKLPRLLSACARKLQTVPVPTDRDTTLALMTADGFVAVAPVLGFLALCLTCIIAAAAPPARGPPVSHTLTRAVLLRGVALCYLAAFLTASQQFRSLYGEEGVLLSARTGPRPTPAFDFLTRVAGSFLSPDAQVEVVSYAGCIASLAFLRYPTRTALVPAALWVLYLSLVNHPGANLIGYGWEWLTLEIGFLSCFFCPLWSGGAKARGGGGGGCGEPSTAVLYLFRWAAFRLMLGAGMSKVGRAASPCWRALTCTQAHYFTQPLPSPAAWYLHHLPAAFHSGEVALVFFEQLFLPFLLLSPLRCVRVPAAVAELTLQLGIIFTGNFAWINFIGSVPVLAALDDGVLRCFFSSTPTHPPSRTPAPAFSALFSAARGFFSRFSASAAAPSARGPGVVGRVGAWLRCVVTVALVAFVGYKSCDPLLDMFAVQPWLHYYDDYFFVNAQGVFGFVNQKRVVAALEIREHQGGTWTSLDLPSLPGSPNRAPAYHSPYHYRLDWEVWIRTTASMEDRVPMPGQSALPAFIERALYRLLAGDTEVASLFALTPEQKAWVGVADMSSVWPSSAAERRLKDPIEAEIRVRYFEYTFSPQGSSAWWDRRLVEGAASATLRAGDAGRGNREARRAALGSVGKYLNRSPLVATAGLGAFCTGNGLARLLWAALAVYAFVGDYVPVELTAEYAHDPAPVFLSLTAAIAVVVLFAHSSRARILPFILVLYTFYLQRSCVLRAVYATVT
ncbi:hypothetical protein DIPPA_17194 [Diplonema papillatum]|nr:hypothetical protein DIPPA_17194 [Diplonema papillatum]